MKLKTIAYAAFIIAAAGAFVIGIRIARAGAGGALDHDLMAALGQLVNSRWQQRHAMFLKLNFLWNANNHGSSVRLNAEG